MDTSQFIKTSQCTQLMSHLCIIYQRMHATYICDFAFCKIWENFSGCHNNPRIKIDLHLLKVALIFCLKYCHCDVLIVFQTNKKVVSCSLLSYMSTWEFLQTLKRREKHLFTTHELIKISAYLCNSAMHSAGFFFLYSMYLYFCFVFAMHYYLHAFHNLAALTTLLQGHGFGFTHQY